MNRSAFVKTRASISNGRISVIVTYLAANADSLVIARGLMAVGA